MIGALILGYFFLFASYATREEKDGTPIHIALFRAFWSAASVAALGYCADLAVRAAWWAI